ncbi:MAG: acyl-CoA desaturase [Flavobacteriales bacterium]|nr:acyl-CoA desaturase [Flavobacteriales bacterium]MCB9198336.1 acyl-CoA desaturase [Flavobacteriales bacterium]
MSLPIVKFDNKQSPEFFKELSKRVNQYFKSNNISKYGNLNMKLKTVFMLSLYLTPFVLMVTGVVTNIWLIILMWAIMGLGMAGIGLSVMHDACHGSYSKNKRVNNTLGAVLQILGGSDLNWKIQHNVLHHTFTNIDGYDEDIDTNGLMRFSPNQERKKMHRFQAFYAPFLYGLMTFFWVILKDFQGLIRYKEKGLLESQGVKFGPSLTKLIISRILYLGVFLVLPILLIDVPVWATLLMFFMMHFIAGLSLALIFQPAHVINDTEFFVPNEDLSVENHWAIHQMKTTANFANRNRLFSWFVGGLNYQVEHHLFPNICHVHYREISKIVKSTAKEYDVPYYEEKTFFGALRNHFTMLDKLGKGVI